MSMQPHLHSLPSHLHIQDLCSSATNKDIQQFFSKAGLQSQIFGIEIIGGTGGDAFVSFGKQSDLLAALQFAGQPLLGQPVKLSLAKQCDIDWARQEALSDIAQDGDPSAGAACESQQPTYLRLQNLPAGGTYEDIMELLSQYDLHKSVSSVEVLGGAHGDAFIAFHYMPDMVKAVELDGWHILGQPVKLLLATQSDLNLVQQEMSGYIPIAANPSPPVKTTEEDPPAKTAENCASDNTTEVGAPENAPEEGEIQQNPPSLLRLRNMPSGGAVIDILLFLSQMDLDKAVCSVEVIEGARGDAFVTFQNRDQMMMSLDLDGKDLLGQPVKLSLATNSEFEFAQLEAATASSNPTQEGIAGKEAPNDLDIPDREFVQKAPSLPPLHEHGFKVQSLLAQAAESDQGGGLKIGMMQNVTSLASVDIGLGNRISAKTKVKTKRHSSHLSRDERRYRISSKSKGKNRLREDETSDTEDQNPLIKKAPCSSYAVVYNVANTVTESDLRDFFIGFPIAEVVMQKSPGALTVKAYVKFIEETHGAMVGRLGAAVLHGTNVTISEISCTLWTHVTISAISRSLYKPKEVDVSKHGDSDTARKESVRSTYVPSAVPPVSVSTAAVSQWNNYDYAASHNSQVPTWARQSYHSDYDAQAYGTPPPNTDVGWPIQRMSPMRGMDELQVYLRPQSACPYMSVFTASDESIYQDSFLVLYKLPLDITACEVWKSFGGPKGGTLGITLVRSKRSSKSRPKAFLAFRTAHDCVNTLQTTKIACKLANAREVNSHFVDVEKASRVCISTLFGVDRELTEEEKAVLGENDHPNAKDFLFWDAPGFVKLETLTKNATAYKTWKPFRDDKRAKSAGVLLIRNTQELSGVAYVAVKSTNMKDVVHYRTLHPGVSIGKVVNDLDTLLEDTPVEYKLIMSTHTGSDRLISAREREHLAGYLTEKAPQAPTAVCNADQESSEMVGRGSDIDLWEDSLAPFDADPGFVEQMDDMIADMAEGPTGHPSEEGGEKALGLSDDAELASRPTGSPEPQTKKKKLTLS